jgi:L,D-peptidoglycan transpeptidase YkuD (ErfK/YbiS/YcfS/YnhG family)
MRIYTLFFILILLLIFIGCNSPPAPPEIRYLEVQQHTLIKAGVLKYAPKRFRGYTADCRDAMSIYYKENERFEYLRNFDPAREQLYSVLIDGNKILREVEKIKDDRSKGIDQKISSLNDRIASIKESTSMINEGRLVRKSLSKAEIMLKEADLSNKKGDYDAAELKLNRVNTYSLESLGIANSILDRYMDKQQLAKWRNLAEATIKDSKQKGIIVFIVSKIDQTLMVYKNGRLTKTYNIGLGRNGLKDKLYSGDGGTPEGRYYIVKKNAASKYYKALLFDYPNNEDKIRFNQAKKKGQIPAGRGIGSLLEIHGGGSDGMTKGCISLENDDMDKLYTIANIGTPLTIVGAINGTHKILSSLKENGYDGNI